MSDVTTKKELYSVDTNTMPWKEFYVASRRPPFRSSTSMDPHTLCVETIDAQGGMRHRVEPPPRGRGGAMEC